MSAPRWPLDPSAVALGLVEDDERAMAMRLLTDDPAFRAEVDRFRVTTAMLRGADEESWEPEPPPRIDVAALAGLDTEPATSSARPEQARSWLRPRHRWIAALAVTAALAGAGGLVAARVERGADDSIPPPPATTIALRPLPGIEGRAQLTLNGPGTEAELRAGGLRPSGAHDYYEAWLADDRGRMVSMGTFRVASSGSVDIHMPVAVDVTRYVLVDVSLEPDDGNPAHSNTSVLRGRL